MFARENLIHCVARRFSSSVSPNIIKSKVSTKWKSFVGLEIHAQINSVSKLFSGATSSFVGPVNSNVSLFDAAIPGTLPLSIFVFKTIYNVLNKKCVELGLLTALALSCKINPVSLFDRKHYFYADLPAGYQITQQRMPLAQDGIINFIVFNPGVHRTAYAKSSHLKQIQLEQDSGKSLHDEVAQRSLIDLNRAGIPLMELVFEPDLHDGEEAAALIKELILIFNRINTCSCKMEEGAVRIDANVSVCKEGSKHLGIRTEVKNIGSIRGVAGAVDFEIQRQIDILEGGGEIVNETRAWNALTSSTVPMRDKEVKQDYRFMPEPNLPPLCINVSSDSKSDGLFNLEEIKKNLPELPEETRLKLKTKYGLSNDFIINLVNEQYLLQLFLGIMHENTNRDPSIVAKLVLIELMTLVNKGVTDLNDGKFNKSVLGELVDLQQSGKINLLTVRNVMKKIVEGNSLSPGNIVDTFGLTQINDKEELVKICKLVLTSNPTLVSKYKNGKTEIFKAIVGSVAKTTGNRANMKMVTQILKDLLK